MAIYRIQRVYSEEENGQKKSGMGTLGKVAIGTALVGGGLLAGKAGILGTTVQRGIGKGMAWTGNKLGSTGMVNEGAKTVGRAAATEKAAELGIKDTSMKGLMNLRRENAGQFNQITTARNTATGEINNMYKITPNSATQAAFSTDTNESLREAALIGTGLTLATGGVLLAKHGKLGKTAKGAYDSVSGKIRKIWKETTIKNGKKKVKKESSSFTTKSPGKPPKTNSVSEITTEAPGVPPVTTVTTKTSGKLKRYPQEVWKRMINYCKSRGLNFRDKKNQEIALAAVTK